MGFDIGLTGLPNVGKSTIFNALSKAQAEVANYPFTTIEANKGIVAVPDPRLERLAELVHPEKVTPTTLAFVDIAGLVEGASRGEGLGNQFLGHIREVDAVAHVVRCFTDPNVAHTYTDLNPRRDAEVITAELLLADLATVERQVAKVERRAKTGEREAREEFAVLERAREALQKGTVLRKVVWSGSETSHLRDYFLLTDKPLLYIANIDEESLAEPPAEVGELEALAAEESSLLIVLCGKLEAELLDLDPAEQEEFLAAAGVAERGIEQLVTVGYRMLDLITFYTPVGPELRAWTLKRGQPAVEAAGKIHSDIARGFIRAEIVSFDEFCRMGSFAKAKEEGQMRLEGRDYAIQDGDVVYFRFSV
ncbi:MAG: redox-regulated ATPase YchF [bacterium]|nr:redox-regulated ATPase YchF [bacterium]